MIRKKEVKRKINGKICGQFFTVISSQLTFTIPINSIIKILPATPAALPDLLPHSHSCERCYSNRECMLNAAVENVDSTTTYGSNKSHASLLQHFTGHLDHVELDYLKNWDRMIDLEASVSNREITKSWLKSSSDLERSLGTTISSLTLDEGTLHDCNQSVVSEVSEFIIKCNRLSCNSNEPPLNSLKFEVGSRGVLSTDGVSIRSSLEDKQQFGLARATVKSIDEQSIYIQVNHADFLRISRLGRSKISEGSPHTFRLDKENFMTGTSTLRQNLMNLFTSEVASFPTKSAASQETATNTLQRGRSTAPLLRRSIIHLDAPRFDSLPHLSMFASSSTSHLSNEFSLLNEDQKAAVYKVCYYRKRRVFILCSSIFLTASCMLHLAGRYSKKLQYYPRISRYRQNKHYCFHCEIDDGYGKTCPRYQLHSLCGR